MAIPLRALAKMDLKSHEPRKSIDSETSAILSYALGKHPDNDVESDIDSPHASSIDLDEEDAEAFFKENDPLTLDYEPFPQKRKSRKFRICLCLFLGTVLLVWIGAFISYLSKGYFLPHQAPASPIASSRRITFDQVPQKLADLQQVLNGDFHPRYRYVEWISSKDGEDGVFIYRDRELGQIIRASVNGTNEVLVYESDIFYPETRSRLHFDKFWVSGNEQYILLATNVEKNWRHSYFALYYIYHIASHTTTPLNPEDPNAVMDYARWSPTDAKISYVYNHDVYILDVPSSSLERVTFDGGKQVFNGVADWVFEEEVFGSPGCLWWSPSSTNLAYIHINESAVPVYSIPYYISDSIQGEPLNYPTFKELKYPKSGYPNPVIDVYIYTPGAGTPAWKVEYSEPLVRRDLSDLYSLFEREEGDETDGWGDKKLITNVAWMGDSMVMVSETNRVSDHCRGVLVDVYSQISTIVRDEKVNDGWFEISHDMMYIPGDPAKGRPYDGYIDVVDRDGYNHLAYFSPLNNSIPQYITGGNWEITGEIAAFDRNTNTVYFRSTRKSPTERHLYSISLSGKNLAELTDTNKDGYYHVSFSPLAQYYLLTYAGPDIPYQYVLSTTDPSFRVLEEDNSQLGDYLKKYDLPYRVYGTVKMNGYSFNYNEIRPPNFDDSGKTKYPVLFHIYGGPVSQIVDKAFIIDWHFWIASEPRLEYLVVQIDCRGTGFMGRKLRTGIRGQLGYLESSDLATAAEQWKSKAYVNPEKFALWGWSFGGFLTLKTLESHPGAFPFAMAVAPVTNWHFYDSIYTERYMLTPQANPLGYRTTAIVNTTALGEAKRFFFAHGTGDDNVHVQNSLALIDRLTVSGVRNWDSQFFTDDDHNINFHRGNLAIYWRLAEWLERWFGRKEPNGRIWKTDGELLGYKEHTDE